MTLVWSNSFTRAVKKLARTKPGLLDDLEATLQQLESYPTILLWRAKGPATSQPRASGTKSGAALVFGR